MKTFDYVAAWTNVIAPLFESFSADAKNLIRRGGELSDVQQGRDLLLDRTNPIAAPIVAELEKLDSLTLSRLSCCANFMTHWFSAKEIRTTPHQLKRHVTYLTALKLSQVGVWKLSNLADQILRGRLGLVDMPHNAKGSWLNCAVHDGTVRVQYSDYNTWQWVEVGPATQGVMNRIMNIFCVHTLPAKLSPLSFGSEKINFDAKCKELRASLWDTAIDAAKDTDRFMVEETR